MVEEALQQYPGDVFLYYGDISREGYGLLSDCLEQLQTKGDKVCLILITYGGDPNAGYRMMRAVRHHYAGNGSVEILIPDVCKSAGTLMCIGADKLIFGDRGEMGPLDIQLSKPDEMFESMSGLDIIQAINHLQNQTLDAFRSYLFDIRRGANIRTKTAAEIATKLCSGFISPIVAKIDPLTLGEHQRAMQIAQDYGSRLNDMSMSLKDYALLRLIGGYPSHGFVIDRKEAGELFNNVSEPDSETAGLYTWIRHQLKSLPRNQLMVLNVNEVMRNQAQHSTEEQTNDRPSTDGSSQAEATGGESELRCAGRDWETSSSASTGNEPNSD